MSGVERRQFPGGTALVLMSMLIIGAGSGPLMAQTTGIPFVLEGTYTTSAKLFLNPNSPSAALRQEYRTVSHIFGGGAEIRLPLTDDGFALAASVEYLEAADEGMKPVAFGGVVRTLPVKDGFYLIPIEVGVVAAIPLGGESVGLTMGAGGGMYVAGRILDVADAGITHTGSRLAYGIHVSFGFSYRILPGVSLYTETRFRDPEVSVTYIYDRASTSYNGSTIVFPSGPMHTRINVDGFHLSGGVLVDLASLY